MLSHLIITTKLACQNIGSDLPYVRSYPDSCHAIPWMEWKREEAEGGRYIYFIIEIHNRNSIHKDSIKADSPHKSGYGVDSVFYMPELDTNHVDVERSER